jgi:hypothetical protein
MGLLELCLVSELEALWSAETDKLMQSQAQNSEGVSTPLIDLEVYLQRMSSSIETVVVLHSLNLRSRSP